MRRIDTIAQLAALQVAPVPSAFSKVADHLTSTYQRWVQAAR
jgi:hypothetical protein